MKKLVFILFILINGIKSFSNPSASFQINDTPVVISKCNTYITEKDKPYFPIMWYEGYSSNGANFSKTDWSPYSPNFISPFNDLSNKDSFHRIGKLYADSIATGIILYNRFYKNQDSILVNNLISNYNFEFYLQTYSFNKKKTSPIIQNREFYDKILSKYKGNCRVNIYFNDDVNASFWNENNTSTYFKFLRETVPEKYFLSATSIYGYLNPDFEYLINYVDIIAPQIYPCRKKVKTGSDLIKEIPEFYHHTWFHKMALNGKNIVTNYNKEHSAQKIYFVTLGTYHINRTGRISRFPTYNELKFQFYDAIICGAKGIDFFCYYRSDLTSYKNIKKIVSEFRKTKFEDAVINGKYCPEIIQSDNLKINNDVSDQYGKDLWDCDYALYYYNEIYYLIISNNSSFSFEVQLNFDDLKIMKIERIVENEKVQKIRFQNNSFDLHLSKYEIALFKIYGN